MDIVPELETCMVPLEIDVMNERLHLSLIRNCIGSFRQNVYEIIQLTDAGISYVP